MFTGIVETLGTVVDAVPTSFGKRLRLDVGTWAPNLPLGSSVCVNGVCLTAARSTPPFVDFEVVHETLRKTTIGRRQLGDRVNLERSLMVGDRLDGHFVQGHVDGTAEVAWVRRTERECVLTLRSASTWRRFLIPKGSVALDGVSLTIAELEGGLFSVALIPTTIARTNLGALRQGDWVNVETDMLVRAVVHQLPESSSQTLTIAALREAGFA